MSNAPAFAAAVFVAILFSAAACNSSKGEDRLTPLGPAPVVTTAPDPASQPRLTGPEVVAQVAARYPEKLAADVSDEERTANMEFLRDRIIEVGTCSGLFLAWNRKQSGRRSIDAIDWRHGEEDINDVVDLALDHDNTDAPLRLQWMVVGGPAGWDPYPTPTCQAL